MGIILTLFVWYSKVTQFSWDMQILMFFQLFCGLISLLVFGIWKCYSILYDYMGNVLYITLDVFRYIFKYLA